MITIRHQSNTDFIKVFIVSILVVVLFAKPLSEFINIWRVNDDYSHGFFVIPLSLYMVWQNREIWKRLDNDPSWLAFSIFIVSLFIYLAAFLARFHTLRCAAIILILLSLCVSFFGWKKSKHFLVPILFLIFMCPIPSSIYIMITNPLKLFITGTSALIIRTLGIPVLQEGNVLFFAKTNLEVAEACSGLRSIYSYLMLGIVFSFFCKKILSKLVITLSAIPLAIIVNIFRVTITGLLSHYFGEKAAQGFFHEFTGMVLFGVGLVMMFGFYFIIEGRFTKKSKYQKDI